MEQKRVSFKVAKAIKEAGYPQGTTKDAYALRNWQVDIAVIKKFVKGKLYSNGWRKYFEMADAPTYLEVWLWLWREKKFSIDVDCYNCGKWTTDINGIEFNDPEEAIISAIDYLVDNNLIK